MSKVSHRVAVAAGVIAAAGVGSFAAPAWGQGCIWTSHASVPGVSNGVVLYHGGLGRVLMLGSPGSLPFIEVWAWDGSEWTRVGGISPVLRVGFRAVYDSDRGRVVVFGGRTDPGFYLADTWEWDGTDWMQSPAAGPPGREQHGMVYDEARHRTVLFGGTRSYQPLGDTWEWDGQQWAQVAAGGPSARGVGAIGYDPVRGRTVLVGSVNWNPVFQDHWEWDGLAWERRADLAGSGRSYWMEFDRGRGLMVLGRDGQPRTLELDPLTGGWTGKTPDFTVGAGTAAYDPGRMRIVVGGTHEFDGAGTVQPAVIVQYARGGGSYAQGETVVLSAAASGSDLVYRWFRNGQALSDDGRITGAATAELTVRELVAADSGNYSLEVRNGCGLTGTGASITVLPACYANCDGSTIPPVLNVSDFVCFMNRYRVWDPYANCDDSSVPPRFNVSDFICFMYKYSVGCS